VGVAVTAAVIAMIASGSVDAATGVSPFATRAHAKPRRGSATASFTIAFTTPITTGVVGTSVIYEAVEGATDNLRTIGKNGCISTFDVAAGYGAAGSRIRVRVSASAQWCAGAYRGEIVELKLPVCVVKQTCASTDPVELARFGHFKFRVSRAPARASRGAAMRHLSGMVGP